MQNISPKRQIKPEEFLRALVLELSSVIKCDYAFVGEVSGAHHDRVKTIAVAAKGTIAGNFEYSLAGTPCNNVVGREICFYSKGVQGLFPEDRLLVDMGVESYLGVPLFDISGNAMGIIAVLDGKPMREDPDARLNVLTFAHRASVALERMHAEAAALKEGYGLYQALAQAADDYIFIIGKDFHIQYLNDSAAALLGHAEENVTGKPLKDFFPGTLCSRMTANLQNVFDTGKPQTIEDDFSMPGKDLWLSTRLTPISDANGDVKAVLGVSRDITERIRWVDTVINQRDLAQKYLDIAGVIILILGADGKIKLINKMGCAVLGYAEDEMVGRDWFSLFIPERLRDEIRALFGRIIRGELRMPNVYENAVLTKGGEERIIKWTNNVIRDDSGRIAASLSSGEDVTERRRREAEREKLITELKEAVSNVKTLRGLLPICASCKKIRNDKGYWQRIEVYIQEHSEADFSHGICPECAKRLDNI